MIAVDDFRISVAPSCMLLQNIKVGNKELKKTIAVNRSTQRYILVLLLAASLGLLLLDWMNS